LLRPSHLQIGRDFKTGTAAIADRGLLPGQAVEYHFPLNGAERTARKPVVLREVLRAEIALHDASLSSWVGSAENRRPLIKQDPARSRVLLALLLLIGLLLIRLRVGRARSLRLLTALLRLVTLLLLVRLVLILLSGHENVLSYCREIATWETW
jgi:hypothetical protein